MNAVREFCAALDRRSILNTLGPETKKVGPWFDTDKLRSRLVYRYQNSLADFLNRSLRAELERMCRQYKLDAIGPVYELRARLWIFGATLEAGGVEHLGLAYQPTPIVFSGRLVFPGAVHGRCPDASEWPRSVPARVPSPVVGGEPESLEELLANADRLLGLRLGNRGRDKGTYGTRVASLLGVPERGFAEADWRGEVEIKTVPVVRDSLHWWRVKEDPAIAMENVDPRVKLRRVLWVARVEDGGDSPILSWYYQEWDARVETLASRYLHHRPKGPAGTTNKGWYLQKRYFLYSGFLRSLNG